MCVPVEQDVSLGNQRQYGCVRYTDSALQYVSLRVVTDTESIPVAARRHERVVGAAQREYHERIRRAATERQRRREIDSGGAGRVCC